VLYWAIAVSILAVAAFFAFRPPLRNAAPFRPYIIAAVALPAVIAAVWSIFVLQSERERQAVLNDPSREIESAELARWCVHWLKCRRFSLWKGWQPDYDRIVTEFHRRGLAPPRFIVDDRIAPNLERIPSAPPSSAPQPIERLEPARFTIGTIVLSGGALLILIFLFGWTGWRRFLISLLVAFLASQIALFVRHALTGVSIDHQCVVAPGIADFGADGVVRSDSCITLVFKSEDGPRVRILSEDRRPLELEFNDVDDPALIRFWSHWSAPHPRPELLE